MAENNLIINNRKLNYQGIFKVNELFSTINQSLEDKGYNKNEKKTEEMVTENGKNTYVELRPAKTKSDYYKVMMKIKINLNNITEVKEKLDNRDNLYQKGNVTITFDSWVITEFENRWVMKSWVSVLRAFVDRFIYKLPEEPKITGEIVSDTAYVYSKIKHLLNSYVPKDDKKINEEEIKKQVEKEMKEELN